MIKSKNVFNLAGSLSNNVTETVFKGKVTFTAVCIHHLKHNDRNDTSLHLQGFQYILKKPSELTKGAT